MVEEQGLTPRYEYDFLKQITQVTDDAENKTNVDYDKLGRRTVIDNPDTGSWCVCGRSRISPVSLGKSTDQC